MPRKIFILLSVFFMAQGLKAAEPWFFTLDGLAGFPVAPQEYSMGSSITVPQPTPKPTPGPAKGSNGLYGAEAYLGYRFYQGYSLGLGFDYAELVRQAGNLGLAFPQIGLQADLPQMDDGTPYLRLSGGYNTLSSSDNAWSGHYVAMLALGYLLPISDHVGMDFALGYLAASPRADILQAPFVKVGLAFGGLGSKAAPAAGPAPTSALTPAAQAKPGIALPAQASYMVKPKDTLWAIAGGEFKDSFYWPLVYRDNRDQIQDPDLIYPRQELRISKEHSEDELKLAVEKAKQAPGPRAQAE
jgi:hypothetical protein